MGYGEFGGTGSVNFKVVHDQDGNGQKQTKDGKDKHAGAATGDFVVAVNGLVVARVPIDKNNSQQVLVIWPPDTLASIPKP